MDTTLLERYYEQAILPLYGSDVPSTGIIWKDHGKVGADSWAHYFEDRTGREYVLLYEDFPGNDYLNDDMTHEIILCEGETSVRVTTTPESSVDNVVGYFTLYAERTA